MSSFHRAQAVRILGSLVVAGCAQQAAGPKGTGAPKETALVDPYLLCGEAAADPKSERARAAVEACRTAAEAGAASAAFNLSRVLHDNPDLPDAGRWLSWCERAAAQGHPIAQYIVATQAAGSADPRAWELLRSACAGFPPALQAIAEAGVDVKALDCPRPIDVDGKWEGTLAIVARDGDRGHSPKPVVLRLGIDGESATVKVRSGETWKDVKPTAFRIRRHKGSAVIEAIDDGWDDDGNWVETCVFTVSVIDRDHLRAVYHRVVNNLYAPRAHDQSVWWYMAAGDLSRVPGSD